MLAQNQNKGVLYVGGNSKSSKPNLNNNRTQNQPELTVHENRKLTLADEKLKK